MLQTQNLKMCLKSHVHKILRIKLNLHIEQSETPAPKEAHTHAYRHMSKRIGELIHRHIHMHKVDEIGNSYF